MNEKAEFISRNRMNWLFGDCHILEHGANNDKNLRYYNT